MSLAATADLLEQGLALHRRGAVAEAAARYADVLRADPDNADALYGLGLIACQRGRFDEGADWASKALAANPQHARAHVLFGRSLNALGRKEEALASLERAIALAPDLAQAHGNRADVLSDLGRHAEAIASYDRAVALNPQSVEDWFNRGVALAVLGRAGDALASFDRAVASKPDYGQAHLWRARMFAALGRHREALEAIDKALSAAPDLVDAWLLRGDLCTALDRKTDALASYDRAIAIKADVAPPHLRRAKALLDLHRPDDALRAIDRALALGPGLAEAWLGRANILSELGRHDEALAACDRALVQRPEFAEAWLGRGNVCRDLAQFEEALADYDKALALQPQLAAAHLGRGNVCFEQGRHDEAEAAFAQALALQPTLAEAWLGRGNVHSECRRPHEALAAYDKALQYRPELAAAWLGRGNALFELTNLTEALAAFDRAQAIRPDARTLSNRIFALDFASHVGFAEQQAARAQWWRVIGPAVAARPPLTHRNDRTPDRKIKLGYVSADFRNHSAGLSFRSILLNHDTSQFDVTCYSGTLVEDDITESFRRAADRWRNVARLSDDALCEHIQADAIDILVDLSGHSAGNRLCVFARKPAPIQVTAWGHATGTGLPTIDYLFSDPVACPPAARHLFAEKIYDLPCLITIDALPERVAPSPPPVIATGGITFGVFNRANKILPETVAVWARILNAVPGSKMLLKHFGFGEQATRQRLLDMFGAHGIAPDRILFRGATSRRDHLAAFGEIDISLDPFPQNGGISTWESLQRGVPVVAMLGNSVSSRLGGAILSAVGLTEWVAEDGDGYCAIAAQFARSPERLTALRHELPQRLASSAAGNSAAYTRAVEQAYRTMWAAYCRGNNAPGLA